MGKARILSGGTGGLYTIEIDYGTDRRAELLTPLTARSAALAVEIAAGEVALTAAKANTALALQEADLAIQAFAAAQQAEPEKDHTDLMDAAASATEEVIRARGQENAIRIPLALLKAERAQLQRRIRALSALQLVETRSAWCATRTTSASGVVATAEIPGEPQSVLIQPNAPTWSEASGRMLAREVMSPEQAFWNAAVLPGWQKWKPTYRKGTITSIDKDLDIADVSLDAAISSAAKLGVNQQTALSAVPVVYMTCNAAVFEIGDRCLVQFVGMSQESPRVVGFVSNPKSCQIFVITYLVSFTSAPDEGCVFPPTVVISNNGGFSFVQNILSGDDCVPVSLLNTSEPGNIFNGWSDGNSSPSRHDLDIQENATYTASVLRTPSEVAVRLVLGIFGENPPITYVGVACDASLEYTRVSMPETRYSSANPLPPGFANFAGEQIVLAAAGFETMTFTIVYRDGTGGYGMYADRV
jgi:hypothetical protein